MNYPYPIPGISTTAVADNYFYVGNECCAGNLTKSYYNFCFGLS